MTIDPDSFDLVTVDEWRELWKDEPRSIVPAELPDDQVPFLVVGFCPDLGEHVVMGVGNVTLH